MNKQSSMTELQISRLVIFSVTVGFSGGLIAGYIFTPRSAREVIGLLGIVALMGLLSSPVLGYIHRRWWNA